MVLDMDLVNKEVQYFSSKIGQVARALNKWGNDTFGKIRKKIKALQREIESLNMDPSNNNSRARVRELESERDRLYGLEEHY